MPFEIYNQADFAGITAICSQKVKHQTLRTRMEFNLDNLIESYFEQLSAYSGWYSLNTFEDASRKLIFAHSHGPKWIAFLKLYLARIKRSETGTEPEVTIGDEMLTFTCKMSQINEGWLESSCPQRGDKTRHYKIIKVLPCIILWHTWINT
jgi:hypothetical protein